MLALQSPIEYQKEQSAGATSMLRKTNSQPASIMLSTLTQPTNSNASAHAHYARMTSDPQSKTLSRLRSEETKDGSRGMDRVKGREVKGQRRSGSPLQSKHTLFGGLRSSLIRLSKSPSHEDLIRETSSTSDLTTNNDAAATEADEAVADNDDNNNVDNDDDVKVNFESDSPVAAESDNVPGITGTDAVTGTGTGKLPQLNGDLVSAADCTETVIPGNIYIFVFIHQR